ncbi:MAG: hypothetical protein AAFQ36_00515 [Pseudomonadota bacterium]
MRATFATLALATPFLMGTLSWGGSAQADTLELIVDRVPYGVELYLRGPATAAESVFDLPPAAFEDAEGEIRFDDFRQVGTADIGDAMFANVSATLDGEAAALETISLMVHPVEAPLPFATPFDGLVSIEICTVPTPEGQITLADLEMYAGFVAYTENTSAEVVLGRPVGLGTPSTVNVRMFEHGEFTDAWNADWAPGEALVIPEGKRPPFVEPSMAFGIAAALFALLAVATGRRPKRSQAA